MKTVLTIIISILFVSTCCAQQDLLPAFPNEISYEGDVAYFNGSPFNGLLVDEKTKKRLGEFRNGYKNGTFTDYFANGKKKSEGKYINGIKEGIHLEWFLNGNKKSECKYVNGQRDGIFTEWFENKSKKSETNCVNGNYDGLHTEWFSNGQQKLSYIYNNGNKANGKYIIYRENGQKEKEENYSDSNGDVTDEVFYENGQIVKTIKHVLEFHSSGKLYRYGYLVNGKKDGSWFQLYDNRQRESVAKYENGILNGEYFSWYDNGQKKDEGIYKDGKKEGLWFSWFENEEIKCMGNYINDKKDGEFIEKEDIGDQKIIYYKNGNIDILTTNSVKYYKPAKNSKLLQLPVKSNNEIVIVNLIFESRGINESDFYSYINDPSNRGKFPELPESKYDTFKDLIINYKI